jgi:hypothetical protein
MAAMRQPDSSLRKFEQVRHLRHSALSPPPHEAEGPSTIIALPIARANSLIGGYTGHARYLANLYIDLHSRRPAHSHRSPDNRQPKRIRAGGLTGVIVKRRPLDDDSARLRRLDDRRTFKNHGFPAKPLNAFVAPGNNHRPLDRVGLQPKWLRMQEAFAREGHRRAQRANKTCSQGSRKRSRHHSDSNLARGFVFGAAAKSGWMT